MPLEHRESIGCVRSDRGDACEHKRWKRKKASTAGNGIDDACKKRRNQQQNVGHMKGQTDIVVWTGPAFGRRNHISDATENDGQCKRRDDSVSEQGHGVAFFCGERNGRTPTRPT